MNESNFLMLNVGYAVHNADWNFNNINSPFTRIYYVTEGYATVTTESCTYPLTPGNMYIIPAFTGHSDSCSGVFKHFYIHIYELPGTGEGVIDSHTFPFCIPAQALDLVLFKSLCSHNSLMALANPDPKIYDNDRSLIKCITFSRDRPLHERLEATGIIQCLLGRFLKFATPKFSSKDRRIRQAVSEIGERIYDNLLVEDLAEEAGMSVDHFIRLFKSEVGSTPSQFIIDRKLTRARYLLASTPMPIKEIAYSLGYSDISYFTRLFKKHVEATPRRYRDNFNVRQPMKNR